jgi:hypothetical protein
MKIGKLKKVDLRQLWKGEASDFTPWLAKEENVEQLSEVIGIELEVISEEKSVGPFRADILCKSTIDDTYVLVENQLEKTDHNHLGQLMTYAAGLEAVTILWIAKKFTEEHRAALDWLNRITDEEIRFFGIEIEAYKIGDSDPAPLFQIISKPNDWTKAIHTSKKQAELTETKKNNLEYWTEMKSYFESSGTKIRSQKPFSQGWTNFAIGRSNFHLAAAHSVRDKFIRVEFWINGNNSKEIFDELKDKYESSSYEKIGSELIWDKLEDKKVSIVYIKKSTDVNNRSEWPDQFKWILDKLQKMETFFRPKIKTL